MRFKARKLVLFIGVGLLIFTLSACKDLRNDKDANSGKDVKKEESNEMFLNSLKEFRNNL